ncbi:MAG TPA: hypothetical protein VKV27_11985 [Solirubrobacteraceae bacterium]|nr:hypothetical protein [Solirubrobacteraceae bacterium]
MSDYFDSLELELRAAVVRAAVRSSRAGMRTARLRSWIALRRATLLARARRPRPATVGVSAAVVTALAVAALALVELGHGRTGISRPPAPAGLARVRGGPRAGTQSSAASSSAAGRSAPGARTLRVLLGDGIGPARFGERQAAVIVALGPLLGAPTELHTVGGGCGVDHGVAWTGRRFAADLVAYFDQGRFSGYQYGNVNEPAPVRLLRSGLRLASARGLLPGLTVVQAARIYGRAFRRSAEQGGSWSVRTSTGRLFGYLMVDSRTGRILSPRNRIASIDAGHVGCPALTP